MKKSLFMGLCLFVSASAIEAKAQLDYAAAKKEAFVPYYMKKTDSSKINAIKTNQAGCDCGDDDCSSSNVEIIAKQQFINLKNANVEKSAAGKLLITLI